MKNRSRNIADRLVMVFLFTGILIICLAVRFDFYYDLNDDTAIRDILSGRYTGVPNGYCIQMLYPLGGLIAAAYRAIRKVSWYGLFLCLCQFGVLALVGWRLTALSGKRWVQAGLLVLEGVLALGLIGRELVIIQYSVTSGLCMAGALFWYLSVSPEQKPVGYLRANVIPILLVLLSFMIRTEMCIMLLPFVLLAGFSFWMKETKPWEGTNVRKYFFVIGCALLGMMILYSLNSLAYRSEQWKSFRTFFDARTKLYDFYGIPEYGENRKFYESIGLSQESYTLLENYNFALDDSIDENTLERIVDYQKQRAQNGQALHVLGGVVYRNSLQEAVWNYKERLLSMENMPMTALLIAAYLIYMLLASGRKGSGCYFKLILLWVIRSVLWLYLYLVQRALERVTTPLQVMEFTLLTGWIIQEIRLMNRLKNVKITGVVFLLAVCGVTGTVINVEKTCQEYQLRQDANSRWQSLTDYCGAHSEQYYLVDVYSSTSYQGIPYSDKLFEEQDNSYRNYDICGGWIAKSPLVYDKLARFDIRDIEDALLQGDALFIAKEESDVNWLSDYYKCRGRDVIPKAEDEIRTPDGTTAYVVYRLQ